MDREISGPCPGAYFVQQTTTPNDIKREVRICLRDDEQGKQAIDLSNLLIMDYGDNTCPGSHAPNERQQICLFWHFSCKYKY